MKLARNFVSQLFWKARTEVTKTGHFILAFPPGAGL
jgi:hypothetical protein